MSDDRVALCVRGGRTAEEYRHGILSAIGQGDDPDIVAGRGHAQVGARAAGLVRQGGAGGQGGFQSALARGCGGHDRQKPPRRGRFEQLARPQRFQEPHSGDGGGGVSRISQIGRGGRPAHGLGYSQHPGHVGRLALPVGAERGHAHDLGLKLALVAVDAEVFDLFLNQPGRQGAGTVDPLEQHIGGGVVAGPAGALQQFAQRVVGARGPGVGDRAEGRRQVDVADRDRLVQSQLARVDLGQHPRAQRRLEHALQREAPVAVEGQGLAGLGVQHAHTQDARRGAVGQGLELGLQRLLVEHGVRPVGR